MSFFYTNKKSNRKISLIETIQHCETIEKKLKQEKLLKFITLGAIMRPLREMRVRMHISKLTSDFFES